MNSNHQEMNGKVEAQRLKANAESINGENKNVI
jgi:hypothetical protein